MLGMIEDPVCGMQINIDTAPAQTVVDGEIYYFCSEGCKEAFGHLRASTSAAGI